MVAARETVWEIKPHTRAKHEILKRYLGAWFPILNRFHGRIVYIDGFCGPGQYEGGELGSPLIALDVAATHRRKLTGELVFLFIDSRKDRIDHLKRVLDEHGIPSHFRVEAQCGLFHEKVNEVLSSVESGGKSLAPTFAFVDPFGFKGIPFSLIKRLLNHRHSEVLITFMIDHINRFLAHPNDAVVSHIVEAYGTDECVRIAERMGDQQRIDKLRMLYQKQLATVARFVRFFEMRNKKHRTLYLLFFASNNRVGHVKIKEAMRKVDPQGDFVFSDAVIR